MGINPAPRELCYQQSSVKIQRYFMMSILIMMKVVKVGNILLIFMN